MLERELLSLGRLEAFSDGVFAIAITLLVLELGVSSNAGDHLLKSILHEWPSLLAYFTSFLTIGVIWLQHAEITSALRAADVTLYRLNLLVLLLVSFIPFPTKLVSEYFGERNPERVAVTFYGILLLALAVSLTVFVHYAVEHGSLVSNRLDADTVRAVQERSPSFVLYGVGICLGLVLPSLAVVVYLATAVYLGIPGGTLRRHLRRRHAT